MNLQTILKIAAKKTPTGSAYAAAKEMGITDSAISQWKTGKRAPDADACVKLAELTGIDLKTIIEAAREARAKKAKATAKVALLFALSTVAAVLTTHPVESRAAPSPTVDRLCIMSNYVTTSKARPAPSRRGILRAASVCAYRRTPHPRNSSDSSTAPSCPKRRTTIHATCSDFA